MGSEGGSGYRINLEMLSYLSDIQQFINLMPMDQILSKTAADVRDIYVMHKVQLQG